MKLAGVSAWIGLGPRASPPAPDEAALMAAETAKSSRALFARRQAGENSRCTGESGFTLIEVLVALTILSISLATLLAIFLQGLDRAKESSNEAAARVLAQSLIAQAKAAPTLATGTSTGKINGLQWRLQIQPYGSAADQAAWQDIPAELVATVSWRGDGGLRTVHLSTLKLYPKPGTNDDSDNNNDNSDDNN